MTGRAQMQAFQRTIENAARGMTGPQSQAALVTAARAERDRVLHEQSQRAGIAPTDIVIPDGRRGAPIETAQRVAVIEYGYLREAARDALLALNAKAPKRTGRYAKSFIVLVDGSEAAGFAAIPHDAREVAVVNTQPYARRLEIGRRSDGTPFVVKVRPRFVEGVALEIARRFTGVARVRFDYFDFASAPAVATRRGRKTVAKPVRYPGIRMTPA